MNLPQELIGTICSFLRSKEAFFLVSINRHWMDSILHTQHKIDVEDLIHPSTFCSTMEFCNFLTDVKIERCRTMKSLDLSFLEKMKTTLRSLTIRDHSIGAVILQDFEKLEYLEISRSSALHTVTLKNVPNLKHLNLSKTGIVNASKILEFIDEKSPLETLDLSGCTNLYYSLDFPCPVDSLRVLDLSRTMIHKQVLEKVVKDCPNLQSLRINRCTQLKNLVLRDHMYMENLQMRFCKGLYELRILGNGNLKRLDLSSNAVYGRYLTDILRSNPSLKYVDFSNCYNFNELSEGFDEITLTDLEYLDCNFTPLRDEHIQVIMRVCPALKTLKLQQTEILDLVDCGSLSIEELNISGTNCTNQAVSEIMKNCPNIKKLDLSMVSALRDGQVDFGMGESNVVEVLSIQNTVLTQKTVVEVIDKFPKLRVLNMSRIQIDEHDRCLELKNAKNLERVNACGNNRIEKVVIESCPKLIDLDLSECFRLSSWEFGKDIGFSGQHDDEEEKKKKITVVQCRESFIEFLEHEYPQVKLVGIERSYEKGKTYQQENFLRCLKRNRAKELKKSKE